MTVVTAVFAVSAGMPVLSATNLISSSIAVIGLVCVCGFAQLGLPQNATEHPRRQMNFLQDCLRLLLILPPSP